MINFIFASAVILLSYLIIFQIGTIFANFISGLLLHDIKGWASPFYFFGSMGVLWFICFALLCHNDPESHPYISEKEKNYLKRELGSLERDKTLPPTPWWLIITSAPMISLVICQIGHDFGYFTMITDLPKYMSDVSSFLDLLSIDLLPTKIRNCNRTKLKIYT